jgi:glucokinase
LEIPNRAGLRQLGRVMSSPSSAQGTFLGIEIGGTKLQLVLGDAAGAIRERRRLEVARSVGGETIRARIAGALPGLLAGLQPAAVGAGFGGPVDGRTGVICCSHQVPGWHDFPLGEWLQEQTGCPVVVENDANTAALAEARNGAGRGCSPVFYFNLGSGVGGGLVVDGNLYHGAKSGEVEFGHLRLDRDGTIVEERCSGWAVDRRIRALQASHPDSLLCRSLAGEPGGETRQLAAALAAGDALAREVLDEVSADLAFALSHAVHLFHPEVIVMGGGLSLVGEPLRAAVAERLAPLVMEAFHPCPPVRLAALGEDAVPVGALLLAAQRVEAEGGRPAGSPR